MILEESQILENGAINAGLRLLLSGKAKRILVVIHQAPVDDQLFAFQGKYVQLLILQRRIN